MSSHLGNSVLLDNYYLDTINNTYTEYEANFNK